MRWHRYSVTISFETDAPDIVVEEVVLAMQAQLESLSDGTAAFAASRHEECDVLECFDCENMTVKTAKVPV